MKFAYRALNTKGEEIKDTIEASCREEAIRALRAAGFYPTRVEPDVLSEDEIAKLLFSFNLPKLTARDWLFFSIGAALIYVIDLFFNIL